MMFRSQWFAFEIPDEWWAEAGMRGFQTSRKAYRRSPPSNADNATMVMRSTALVSGRAAPASLTSREIA